MNKRPHPPKGGGRQLGRYGPSGGIGKDPCLIRRHVEVRYDVWSLRLRYSTASHRRDPAPDLALHWTAAIAPLFRRAFGPKNAMTCPDERMRPTAQKGRGLGGAALRPNRSYQATRPTSPCSRYRPTHLDRHCRNIPASAATCASGGAGNVEGAAADRRKSKEHYGGT